MSGKQFQNEDFRKRSRYDNHVISLSKKSKMTGDCRGLNSFGAAWPENISCVLREKAPVFYSLMRTDPNPQAIFQEFKPRVNKPENFFSPSAVDVAPIVPMRPRQPLRQQATSRKRNKSPFGPFSLIVWDLKNKACKR